jgi:hypothetical protein
MFRWDYLGESNVIKGILIRWKQVGQSKQRKYENGSREERMEGRERHI